MNPKRDRIREISSILISLSAFISYKNLSTIEIILIFDSFWFCNGVRDYYNSAKHRHRHQNHACNRNIWIRCL